MSDKKKNVELKEEFITYSTDYSQHYPFQCEIELNINLKEGTQTSVRPFEAKDMERVLDFDNITDAPPDGPIMICEPYGAIMETADQKISFPVRHICVRGSFLFVYALEDVDNDNGPYTLYNNDPIGLLPIDNTVIEFPPGGRRVFQEHARTNARSGYELAVVHMPPKAGEQPQHQQPQAPQPPGGALPQINEDEEEEPTEDNDDNVSQGAKSGEHGNQAQERRAVFFIVANSLGEREKWSNAIKKRAVVPKPTKLRADYVRAAAAATTPAQSQAAGDQAKGADSPVKTPKMSNDSQRTTSGKLTGDSQGGSKHKRSVTGQKTKDGFKGILESGEDDEIRQAITEFGALNFNEQTWMDTFFTEHSDFDAPARCSQMEHFQACIKKNLKAAVLEQYEYFVQASGEMTTMGREVSSLRTLVETQVETIKEMKEIDFSSTLLDLTNGNQDGRGGGDTYNQQNGHHDMNSDHHGISNGDNETYHSEDDSDHFFSGGLYGTKQYMKGKKSRGGVSNSFLSDDHSELSSMADDVSVGRKDKKGGKGGKDGDKDAKDGEQEDNLIEVPTYLDDVPEVFSALMKECRYSDAIEHWNKAKEEISDLFDKHMKPIQLVLSRKDYDRLRSIQRNLDRLVNVCALRIEESLRRKNEALKQGSKRERSDPHSAMAPILSPCCLDDDAIPLQLLVRLGKTQAAANAYSTRRSLLLLESLHEHPISGAGSVDLVIYSAQLSQSFFSCLASSVEGFLDLFVAASQPLVSSSGDNSNGQTGGNLGAASGHGTLGPMGASMLNLSYSVNMNNPKSGVGPNGGGGHIDDNMSVSSTIHSSAISKTVPAGAMASIVLWCDSELAKFATAFGGTRILANLALSPPPRNKPPRNINGGDDNSSSMNGSSTTDATANRERQNAIEVAAQCVEQAFSCASQNLDSVGLPLTPRLAEFIRSRLKGCEAEVAQLLDNRWYHITLDWRAKLIHHNDNMSMDM